MNFSWLWESWRLHLSGPWVDTALTPIALMCGFLLGNERQRREKPAGLRTLSLVCLGSAIFTMASFAFTSTTGDSGRVAAQIVTGIGFLGAGVILHGKRFVTGVTTAAVIWVAAAIGMVVGAGYPFAGLALSILVNRCMVLATLFETRWHPDLHIACFVVEYAPNRGITRIRLERVLVDYAGVLVKIEWAPETADTGRVALSMRLARAHMYEMLAEIADVADVRAVMSESCERVARTEAA
jgi:putative Mg2+ transporter-C (MgtC) family protein